MQRLNIPPNGRPCGKKRWHSQVEAKGHLAALEASERTNGRQSLSLGPLAVYRCEDCQAYHVGHRTV